MRYFAVLFAVLFGVLQSSFAAPLLVVSEVVADNRSGLSDAEGDPSDWIEITNPGLDSVDLTGWFLTDSVKNLSKWQFPGTNILGGSQLIVFASGKDKRVLGLELHTNFRLASSGQTVALVRPDGTTIEHQLVCPAVPPDTAYGLSSARERFPLLGAGSSIRWIVPLTANDEPSDWNQRSFSDAAWTVGAFPVGFDAIAPTNTTLTLTNLARGKIPTQSTTLIPFTGAQAVDGKPETFTHTLAGQSLPARWEVSLRTSYLIESITLRNRPDCCQSRLRDITVIVMNESGTTTNFVSALLNPENTLQSPASLVLDFTKESSGFITGGRIRVIRTPDPDLSGGDGTGDEADVLSMAEVEIVGRPLPPTLREFVATDLTTPMSGRNSSALLRSSFLLPTIGDIVWQQLLLRARYDDGFVGYLNGVEVLRRNAPSNAVWDSRSLTNRSKVAGLQIETIDLSKSIAALRPGFNVFAIRLLNADKNDPDLLFAPVLEASGTRFQSGALLATPTPGDDNAGGFDGFVDPVVFSVPRGFYAQPVTLQLDCITPGCEIRYTLDGSVPTWAGGRKYQDPITITNTLAVRAAAYKTNFRSSGVMTHSYFFLEDVIRQTPASALASGFPSAWGGSVTPDYGMDPKVIGQGGLDAYGGKYAGSVRSDLRSLPTLSIVLNRQDFFGPSGIYGQSDNHGDEFERDASAELMSEDGATLFQINAGLRVQGGAFRSDGLTKKHSLRLLFNATHGPTKLKYPLFGSDGPNAFDTLTLRANSNDGYSWSDAGSQPLYIRDSFGRNTVLEMAGVASHHQFVHLYVEGLYWGLYEILERPDASFAASNFGGDKTEYDSLNSGAPTEGDTRSWEILDTFLSRGLTSNSNYFAIQGRNANGTRNSALTNYLDVSNMIDYMIVNLYLGNSDWPSKNFWVARRKGPQSQGFKFFMWDSEWSLGLRSDLETDVTTVNSGVAAPYGACVANAEFRVQFGDHLHRHFFNDGVLSVDAANPNWDPTHPQRNRPAQRFSRLAESVQAAMVAESARWGDMHISPPYTRDEHWAVERDTVLQKYFPQRSFNVLQQFQNIRLYPLLTAPVFSRAGGRVRPGDLLLMGAPAGKIYYTTNGDDPRLIGGAVALTAQEYSSPIALPGRCRLKARAFLTNSWSALQESVFTQSEPFPLRVAEIHYHPIPASADSVYFTDDSEFIELVNVGPNAIDLRGVRFSRGLQFDFSESAVTNLAAGGRVVVVRNRKAFESVYGLGLPVAGEFIGTLGNVTERITLLSPFGEVVQDFQYDSRWHPATDGMGFSLISVSDTADAQSPQGWKASSAPGGTPGTADLATFTPRVLVNEVLSRATAPQGDFVELLNTSPVVADISGWFLTDDSTAPKKYRIPANTLIAPGGYYVVSESQYGKATKGSTAFSLSSQGESAYLFAADATGELTGYAHGFSFGASSPNVSWMLVRSNEGEDELLASPQNTSGAQNPPPHLGPVVISQILPGLSGAELPWVAIRNLGDVEVPLFDPANPTHTWRIAGIGWDFPPGLSLPPHSSCVVVQETPAAFRSRYRLTDSVLVVGPFSGRLDEKGESVQLQRPEQFGNAMDYVTVDRVDFQRAGRWPNTVGHGVALRRVGAEGLGVGPGAWVASLPQPDAELAVPNAAPHFEIQPESRVIVRGRSVELSALASGDEALEYQWFKNDDFIGGATHATMNLAELMSPDAGEYRVRVVGRNGSAMSSTAVVSVLEPPHILRVTGSKRVVAGTDLTLSVTAAGVGTVRYQWQREGVDLTGATESSLVLRTVQTAQSGGYSVRVTDDIGTSFSSVISVLVFVRPAIRSQPFSTTALEGQEVSFRVEVDGTTPLTYRWRKDGKLLTNAVFQSGLPSSALVLPNVAKLAAGLYSVTVSNVSGSIAISSNATLVVLSDADQDGMPDDWEKQYGLDPNNPADALGDLDGDGVINRDEYALGTHPKLASTGLKLESFVSANGDVSLQFLAGANRTFTVYYKENWGEPWRRLMDLPALATPGVRTVVDKVRIEEARYYKVTTPIQSH